MPAAARAPARVRDAGLSEGAATGGPGVDAEREAALELVTLGPRGAPAAPVAALEDLRHPYVPLSSSEVDYPLLREIHRASMLHTPDDVRAWREAGRGLGGRPPRPVSPRALVPLPAAREASGRSLGETIQRRGSTRQFGLVPLSAVDLATALWSATRSVDADVPTGLVDLYLIVNAVDGVEPGAYHYRPEAHALELLKAGRYRNESAYLCLEQPLGGDAAAVIYFLAPLDRILPAFGDRGYRLANPEARVAGGRAHPPPHPPGFGPPGLTLFYGPRLRVFSPHPAGKGAPLL